VNIPETIIGLEDNQMILLYTDENGILRRK
jgi:hypothetical protein